MHLWCQLLALLQRLVLESSLAVQGTGIQSGTGYWNPVWILWSDLWLRDLESRHLLESRRQHCFRFSVDVSPHSVQLRQQANLVYSTTFWYNCKILFGCWSLGSSTLTSMLLPKTLPGTSFFHSKSHIGQFGNAMARFVPRHKNSGEFPCLRELSMVFCTFAP